MDGGSQRRHATHATYATDISGDVPVTRRRQPTPGPGRDFRALAAERPQQRLVLPPAPEPVEPPEPEAGDVELRLRHDAVTGSRVTLVAALTFTEGDELRRLAERLQHAADALDGGSARS